MAKRYWLLKTEPESFGWDDLKRSPGRTTTWDGVRNYQARNFIRDDMRPGDGALLYHSNAAPPAVAGVAKVASKPYPDPTQFDPDSKYFDEGATPEEPRWFAVDVTADRDLARPVALDDLRTAEGLEDMLLLRRGNRLSVMPVTPAEWKIVLALAGLRG